MRKMTWMLVSAALVLSPSVLAESGAAKVKASHASAKKSFEDSAKEHAAAMKSLEESGAAESRADTKWAEGERTTAEARRSEPQIDLKIVTADRLRRRAERMKERAALDERMANNLEARSKRESNGAQGVRDDAVALRKLAKGEKDAKTKARLEALAKLDEDLAKDMDKDAAKFKTRSEALRKDAKGMMEDADKSIDEAHKLDGK